MESSIEIKQPKAIYFLSTLIMCDLFAYYGMRALLVLFMLKFLKFDTAQAGAVYGWFTGLVYLTPLIGGYIADRYWGRIKSIYVGMVIVGIGQFLLSVAVWSYSIATFYFALTLIIVGTGFFRPNIASTVGTLYKSANDPRRDAGFTIYYMYANLGAFAAPIICGFLGEKIGWEWGFISAAVGVVIGIIVLTLGRKKYLGDNGLTPINLKVNGVADNEQPLTKQEKQKIAVIFIMMFFVVFFWSAFEQAGSSITLFTDQSTNRVINIFGWSWQISTSMLQCLNPLFVIMLAPFISKLWVKLASKGLEPSTPYKFVWGLGFLGFGFVLMVMASAIYETSGSVTMLWLIGVYLFHSLGELCISPIGSSMVTKLSPLRFSSLMMGVWFGANFIANLTSGIFAGNYDTMDHKLFFLIPVISSAGAALLLFFLAKPIKRWMHGVH